MSSFQIKFDVFLLGLACGLVLLYVAAGGGGFALDDSWIHQTFARNWALHGEWAFILGQPSAASTAPLYSLLLGVGYRLGVPFGLWTHGLGALTLALMGVVGARLSLRLSPNRGLTMIAVALLLVLTWHHIWAAASGMETALFGLLTLVLYLLAWDSAQAPTLGRALALGVLGGALVLLRPEGVLLLAWVGAALLLARPWRTLKAAAWWIGSGLLCFGVVLAPYLWFNWQVTGGLLPNTAAAKFAQHAVLLSTPYPLRFAELALAILAGGQLLLLPGMLAYAWAARWLGREALLWLLPLLWPLSLLALYAAQLPAAYQHGRYVLPALPALVLAGVVGTDFLILIGRSWLLSRVFTRALAISAALTFAYFALLAGVEIYRVDVAIIDQEMVASAFYLRDNLPTDSLLAIHDIGAVGYFAPRPLVDIAGLASPDLIPIVADAEALWRAMQQAGVRYLLAFPDQIPGDSSYDPRLCLVWTTDGQMAQYVGGPNMALYRLAWDGRCS